MPDLPENSASYPTGVRQIDFGEKAWGGDPTKPPNEQLLALASRTAFLKTQSDSFINQFTTTNNQITALNNQITALNTQINTLNSQLQAVNLMPAGTVVVVPYGVTGNPWIDPGGYYWYQADGTAIGNSNTRFQRLYNALWATYPVTGGRGGSAAADWSAGKTLAIPDFRGRAIVSAGAGTGLAARAVGQTWGNETIALTLNELPLHRHNLSLVNVSVNSLANTGYGVISNSTGTTTAPPALNAPNATSTTGIAGNRFAVSDNAGAIRDTGNGAAFGLHQPSAAFTLLMWMNEKN